MEIVHVEKDGNFTWMKNIHLRDRFLSLKAKGLLSVMFSLPKDWDCTITGLAYISKEGVSAIRATIKELEAAGYITRERIRNEAGQLKDMKYTIHETPVKRDPEEPVPADEPTVPDDTGSDRSSDEPDLSALPEPALENPTFDFPTQGDPTQDQPMEQNRTQLNTNRLNTHESKRDKQNTDLSIHPSGTAWQYPAPQRQPWDCGPAGVTAPAIDPDDNHRLSVAELEQRVRDQIEYDFLVTDSNRQELDEIVSIIVEVLAMHGEGFEVGGLLKPPDLVMKNFLALNSEHLEYVFACLDRTRSNVRNIRQYGKADNLRPDAMILGYPVITADEFAHVGSIENVSGSAAGTEDYRRFGLEQYVSDQTPPTFLWHTASDQAVPVENSLKMAEALSRHHVPYELHILPEGAHGMSVCTHEVGTPSAYNARWIEWAIRWLNKVFDVAF